MAGIVTFDTHAFIKKMISTGMPEEQAEALAGLQTEIVTDRLATKDDLALYHKQTETEFAKVRGEIKDLGAELRSEIKELDKKIDVQCAELRGEIRGLEFKILWKVATIFGAMMAIGISVALVIARYIFLA